jgi:two-component system response regulator
MESRMRYGEKYILLVEDNSADEKLIILSFQENKIGNNVIVARDGQEALDFLFSQGKYQSRETGLNPQLIILDLKLPKIDGLEVLKCVREHERTRLIPVVILTSSREEEDIVKAYNLGSNAYVRKPVDFTELTKAMKELGFFWFLLNENPYYPGKRS